VTTPGVTPATVAAGSPGVPAASSGILGVLSSALVAGGQAATAAIKAQAPQPSALSTLLGTGAGGTSLLSGTTGILLIGGAGVAAYFIFKKKKSKKAS
jgi:hypothetical protein